MTAIKTSRFSRTISRLKEAVSDMNYAQQRLFELSSVMGSPNRAPDGDVMGGTDRSSHYM
jgi:hypothetical protein